ncbi:MAG: CPBP family intramembrane metalloprotease [Candidatus Omnitrophica bacterium]|nr:CPBP family intramembrane metalloprotease [Candidatus Omnitrophota bacterium]
MNLILIASYLAAHIFWFILFYPQMSQYINFWIGMTIASGILAITALCSQDKSQSGHWNFRPSYMLVGLFSAIILYSIFFIGHKLSVLLIPFAQSQVGQIYSTKSQMSPMMIGMLLLCWIGPAEEIFWRGFLQKRLMVKLGPNKGYVIATLLYAGVHCYAMNFMLFMAALICAAFWGYLYKKLGALWPVIISHALWDTAIFVLFPIQ